MRGFPSHPARPDCSRRGPHCTLFKRYMRYFKMMLSDRIDMDLFMTLSWNKHLLLFTMLALAAVSFGAIIFHNFHHFYQHNCLSNPPADASVSYKHHSSLFCYLWTFRLHAQTDPWQPLVLPPFHLSPDSGHTSSRCLLVLASFFVIFQNDWQEMWRGIKTRAAAID